MRNLIDDTPAKKNYDFVNNIRCLAMMSIVADHTFNVGSFIFTNYNSAYWIYLFIIQIAKFGTVSFFLLAGFLLGDKFTQYTPSQYLQRRFKSTFKPWIIWSLVFLFGLLLRDTLNYIHFGNGGFDFLGYLKQEAMITFLFSNYWFIINFLICIATLLLFKKHLYNWRLGAVLFAFTLFYSVNVYFEWIIPNHTTAIFGFVFFLWLGAQFNKNWPAIEAKVKAIPFVLILLVFVLALAISMAEIRYLYARESQDPYNTLRITNIAYSMAAFFLMVRINNLDFLRHFKPRETTFGIYLLNAIIAFLILPEVLIHFDLPKPGTMAPIALLGYCLFRFIFTYLSSLLVVMLINATRARWLIGNGPLPPKSA